MLLKILRYFLVNPYKEVYLRELAKLVKLSPFAVKKYIEMLLKERLVQEERRANLRFFRANTSNPFYKQLKVSFSVNSIVKSGLIETLKEHIPSVTSIVLFGSLAKGEGTEESDVDMLVIGKPTHPNLSSFEKKLGREINLHVFSWSGWNKKGKEDAPFYYELISYGVSLYGEMPIIRWK